MRPRPIILLVGDITNSGTAERNKNWTVRKKYYSRFKNKEFFFFEVQKDF